MMRIRYMKSASGKAKVKEFPQSSFLGLSFSDRQTNAAVMSAERLLS